MGVCGCLLSVFGAIIAVVQMPVPEPVPVPWDQPILCLCCVPQVGAPGQEGDEAVLVTEDEVVAMSHEQLAMQLRVVQAELEGKVS